MKQILYLTNVPAPYRVRFFDELGRYHHVTVLYADRPEEHTDRENAWFVEGTGGFSAVHLKKSAGGLCLDVLPWLRQKWDAIVICGYSFPTAMLAISWLRLHHVPFWLEVDGGVIRQERRAMYQLKAALIKGADRYISTGKLTTDYLVHYGASQEAVAVSPFTSLSRRDLLIAPVPREEKQALRASLGLREQNLVLAVGQFIPRKGFDVLLKAAATLPESTAVCIVGGEPTPEYLALAQNLPNVHFLEFQTGEALEKWFRAADVFALPTREDIWGLVINEAMAYGLPVVTTHACVAGQELVEDGVNGFLVPSEDVASLSRRLNQVLSSDMEAMGRASLEKIQPYTIENMARVHAALWEDSP